MIAMAHDFLEEFVVSTVQNAGDGGTTRTIKTPLPCFFNRVKSGQLCNSTKSSPCGRGVQQPVYESCPADLTKGCRTKPVVLQSLKGKHVTARLSNNITQMFAHAKIGLDRYAEDSKIADAVYAFKNQDEEEKKSLPPSEQLVLVFQSCLI